LHVAIVEPAGTPPLPAPTGPGASPAVNLPFLNEALTGSSGR
jgi:hypothetical protein